MKERKKLIVMLIIYLVLMTAVECIGLFLGDLFKWISTAFLCGAIVTWIWLIIAVHICGDKKKEKSNEYNN